MPGKSSYKQILSTSIKQTRGGGANMNTDHNIQMNIPKQNSVGNFTGSQTGSDG